MNYLSGNWFNLNQNLFLDDELDFEDKEEQEHIEWLKGRREKVNPEIEKNMVCYY